MKTLARHSLYLALFLGTLLTIAGLSFYPELSAAMAVTVAMGILGSGALLVWIFARLSGSSALPSSSRPRNVPAPQLKNGANIPF